MLEEWVPAGYLISAIFFIFGLKKLGHPRTAPRGNQYGMLGMAIAVITTVVYMNFLPDGIVGWTLIGSITLFALSIFLGVELITKVPAMLHTPLMSGANAISGISVVGALLGANVAFEKGDTVVSGILAFVAIVLAMINVVGGFAVTNRMLNMIAGKKRGA